MAGMIDRGGRRDRPLFRWQIRRLTVKLVDGGDGMQEYVVTADEKNFSDIIQGSKPVLVDFWAPWCMPCRMVSPILDEIASERQGQVTVAKVNLDENAQLAAKYGVMSIPTVVRFQDGEEVSRVVGAMPKAEITRRLGLS